MKRKFLPLLIFCLIFIFISCGDGEASVTSEPPETADVPAVDTDLTLVENGEAQYAVVLPEGSNGSMREAVNAFADKLGSIYGVKFEVKKNKNLAEGKKLIMVGAQENEEYSSYYADVTYRDYAVKIADDGNIVIAAWTLDSIGDACSKLILRLQKSAEAGDTQGKLTEDIELRGVDSSILDFPVPHFSLTRMPWIYNIQGERGAYELCFKNSTGDDWNGYIEKLTENGFSTLQKSESTDASFAVLKKDGVEITVDYWKKTGELAVLIDKPSYESPLTSEKITTVTSPSITEPGLEYDGALKGMCYIIQASDGSFVLVDSGDSDPKFLDRLYSVMTSLLSEGEKPHIRAWILTHQHSDHISGVVDIVSSKYASLIDCDAIYTNMPYTSYQSAYERSTYENRFASIEKAAKTLGADFAIARTGQTYYFADIEVEILGTVDDMFLTDYNDIDETSMIFTASVGSKKMMFTGDAGPVVIAQYIMKRYTEATLKSDICQAMSHGTNNSAFTAFYKCVDPDWYLWSASIDFYNRHTPNKHIQSDSNAEIVYSYKGKHTIVLN